VTTYLVASHGADIERWLIDNDLDSSVVRSGEVVVVGTERSAQGLRPDVGDVIVRAAGGSYEAYAYLKRSRGLAS
jgi:hypothetical protein